MFRPRLEGRRPNVAVVVDGHTVMVPSGSSAAAATLVTGFASIRRTPVTGSDRGPYCMMGACFDCLAEIDGIPNRQSCMVEVRPGMRIRRQIRGLRVNNDAG